MTITYPLSLPSTRGRRTITFRQNTAVSVSRSPFTGHRQVQRHPLQLWEADVTLPRMLRTDAEPWVAFLNALNGPEGTFLMGDPVGASPRGVATGVPLVKGSGQTGATLVIDGMTPGVTGILLAGSWLQLGSGADAKLHKILQDASSNGSGEVTLDIWPRLRFSPADNDPVTIDAAKGVFSLKPGSAAGWSIDEALLYGIEFSAIEDL